MYVQYLTKTNPPYRIKNNFHICDLFFFTQQNPQKDNSLE